MTFDSAKKYGNRDAVKAKSPKEQGFTLIEVLIAISIFSVGLLAIAILQTSAIRVNADAYKLSERTAYAMDRLEILMALPYSDPWLEAAGNPPNLDSAGNTHQATSSDGFYTISWSVVDNSPVTNSKRITLTVTGKGKTNQFVTVKSQL